MLAPATARVSRPSTTSQGSHWSSGGLAAGVLSAVVGLTGFDWALNVPSVGASFPAAGGAAATAVVAWSGLAPPIAAAGVRAASAFSGGPPAPELAPAAPPAAGVACGTRAATGMLGCGGAFGAGALAAAALAAV